MPRRRPPGALSPTRSDRVAPVTWWRCGPTPRGRRPCSAGRRHGPSPRCAPTTGAGRRPIPTATRRAERSSGLAAAATAQLGDRFTGLTVGRPVEALGQRVVPGGGLGEDGAPHAHVLADGSLGVLEDLTRQLLRGVDVPAVVDEARDEAGVPGLRRREPATGHGHLAGERGVPEPRDDRGGRQPQLDLRHLERGVPRRDQVVAVQRRTQRVAEAVAVHRGDHRLPVHALGKRLALGRPPTRRALVHGALEAVVHVAAARERRALPEQDADLRIVIGVEAPQRLDQRGEVLVAQRVVLLRSVEGQVGDVVSDLVPDGHASPDALLPSIRLRLARNAGSSNDAVSSASADVRTASTASFTVWFSSRFVSRTACGGRPAIRSASSSAASTELPFGTTRFAMPMRTASSAGRRSPKRMYSLARRRPVSSGHIRPPPSAATRPSITWGSEKYACSSISTMSLIEARLHPSPTAGPLTAAMIGTDSAVIPRTIAAASSMIAVRRATSSVIRSNRLRSPPPQNARPAPVMTTARIPSSSASSCQTRDRAPCSGSFAALSASGRLSTRSRTAPRSSTTSSSCVASFTVMVLLALGWG